MPPSLSAAVAAFSCAALVAGCGAPIRAERVDPQTVHRQLTASVLTTGHASGAAMNVLRRLDLDEAFARDPAATLLDVQARQVRGEGGPDEVFALAELSFLHAEKRDDRRWYRAAALYAWWFLFPDAPTPSPDPFDMRLRVAADLYNRGITSGFLDPKRGVVDVVPGTYELPFGWLYVDVDEQTLRWGSRRFVEFTPVAEFDVRGFANRYRHTGIGAPLAARTAPIADGLPNDFVGPRIRIDVTALLRLDDVPAQIARGAVRGRFEIFPGSGPDTVVVGDRRVPLEREPTSALAFTLHQQQWLALELTAFFQGDFARHQETRLGTIAPYVPGRIPVVFVHGTFSSPGRWAEMLNELYNDPRIRDRFQFWFFVYDSGNPIPYSAYELREALTTMTATLDPDGQDHGMRCMVVIGHSQGGLLTKGTAISTGDRLWNNVSKVPIEELDMSDDSKKLLRGMTFIEPLPFVGRLVFIATPHRGSFLAGNVVARLAARFIALPRNLARTVEDVLKEAAGRSHLKSVKDVPTALHNMTPGNRYVVATEDLRPVVPSHSIIPVATDGPVVEGDDGVVEYRSAHVDWAESELIVRSTHSTQGEPATINEVRRILLLHLNACPGVRAPTAAEGQSGQGVSSEAKQ